MTVKSHLLHGVGFCCAVVAATPALAAVSGSADADAAQPAQGTTAAPAQPTNPNEGAIIVTGQKRAENVQNVPKIVDVVNQQQLTQAGVSTIGDLGRVAPSVQGEGGLGSSPAIRGISSFSFAVGVQSQTGIVLDDVPQPTFSTLADELTDVERVEVFPGPQSTLSGRNAAGGLINIVTRRPTHSFTASARVEQTNDHGTRAAAFVSGPIAKDLLFSISTFYNKWDGQVRNVAENGRPINQFKRDGVRGKLEWDPSSDLRITLTGFWTRTLASTNAILSGGPFIFADSANLPVLLFEHPGATIGPFSTTVSVPDHGTGDYRNRGGDLHIDYTTPIGTLSSITSYQKSNQYRNDLTLGIPVGPFVIKQQNDIAVDYTTQEFRLVSPSGPSKFSYLAGAIYSNTDNFQPFARSILFPANWDRWSLVRSVAAYGRGTYQFLPDTSLTVGARYQHDFLRYKWVFTDGTAPTSTGSTKYDFVTGEASLQHDFMPNVKGYLTFADGQTGRVYDTEDVGSAVTPAGLQPLKSQFYTNIEGGFKTQWLDRHLTLNVSAFRTNYKNYQVQAADLSNPNEAATIRLFAVGRVRTQGVDVDANYAVTKHFNLGLGAEYLDAKILDYPGANCYPGQTAAQGCVGGFQDRKGVLPGTSKFRAIGSANLTIPLPSLPFDGTLGAYGRYQSRTYFDLTGNPLATQGGYAVLNLSAGIKDRSGRYSAELFVDNVANKHFYAGVSQDLLTPPVALAGGYARDSFRYWGGRLSLNY